MIRYVKGDATDPQGPGRKVLVHVCNDLGKWGKGFVLAVSDRYPAARDAYFWWHKYKREHSGANFGIGVTQDAWKLGGIQSVMISKDLIVVNMLAQRGYASVRSNAPPIRYDALEQCLVKVGVAAKLYGASLHMPRIGCGLAGGRWDKVEPIIERTLCGAGLAVTVYDFED